MGNITPKVSPIETQNLNLSHKMQVFHAQASLFCGDQNALKEPVARTLELRPPTKKTLESQKVEDSASRELRSETRVPVRNQLAEVMVLCWGTPKMFARVVDISRSGIGLMLANHLPEGTWVKLKIGQVVIFGHVRYCRNDAAGGFRAGLISDTVITNPQS